MKPSRLTGEARAAYVQAMFSRIARRYDLMNRLMTAGQDVRWRDEVVRRAALPAGGRLLDLGTGTGDLALAARRQYPGCSIVAADFTVPMMQAGQARLQLNNLSPLSWCAADALLLPFPTGVFDVVISGFLMRNVSNLDQAIAEQVRVLKPGGKIVILDTTRPSPSLLTPFIKIYLRWIIPFLGRLVAGSREAYTYLPESTQEFLTAPDLAQRLTDHGFHQVGFQRRMFATISIHWGVKLT
jgi:demethylmenaquinone methyltransferase/2-methoxy-6-polyprenyl-1,4-benzoquinol methylase